MPSKKWKEFDKKFFFLFVVDIVVVVDVVVVVVVVDIVVVDVVVDGRVIGISAADIELMSNKIFLPAAQKTIFALKYSK